jgi:hypothetical protein
MTSLQRLRWFDTLHTSIDSIKGLGELTNLRILYLRTGFSEDVDMNVLNSSLGKLCNLDSLNVFSPDSWIPEALTLSPPPPNLMRLSMMRISRVPNWIGELNNLQSLHITVDKLNKDDVRILAELPTLIDLELTFNRALEETIVIYGTAFTSLERFVVYWIITPQLTFRAGTMPKLKRLSLHLNARGWKQDKSTTPTGIEHLLALEKISVGIGSDTESEQRSAESAIRSAIIMHPSHAHVKIDIQCY